MNKNLYGLGDYNTQQIKILARVVQMEDLNNLPIFYRRPDGNFMPTSFISEIPLDEVSYIIPDSFAGDLGEDLASHLTLKQLVEIGINGEEYLREAIKLKLIRAFKKKPNDMRIKSLFEYINSSAAWQL